MTPVRPAQTRMRRIEKSGWFMIGTAIVFGLAAVNSGNNILYLADSFILSLFILSGQISRRGLRSLQITLEPPEPTYARRLTKIRVRLHNTSRLWFIIGLDMKIVWERVRPTEPSALEEALYEVRRTIVFPGDRRKINLAWSFNQRGRYRLKSLIIGTRGPFGWFYRQGIWNVPMEVIIYPEPMETHKTFSWLYSAQKDTPRITPDHAGDDFYGLREYLHGDAIRQIHWPSSARIGTWQVRLSGVNEMALTWIILDRRIKDETLENTLRWLTSFFIDAVARQHSVGFVTQGLEPTVIQGTTALHRVLGELAQSEPANEPLPPEIFTLPGLWLSSPDHPPVYHHGHQWIRLIESGPSIAPITADRSE